MKYNRLNDIELYLSQKQYASIDDLLEKFNISLQTLRRDLKELQGRGVITKVYGGVLFKRVHETKVDVACRPSIRRSTLKKRSRSASWPHH